MQAPASNGERRPKHAYWLCGLRLDSDFELPALPEWQSPPDAAADVTCRCGRVPTRLERPDYIAPIFQTAGTGEYLLVLAGTGRVLIRHGSEITVEPESGLAATNLSAVLTGLVQAVLWHQRGLLPLHASVVVIGGRAVALCGPGASGKSTLAAVLAAQGYLAIADDICVVDGSNNGGVLVHPGGMRLQLWGDALADLGVATDGLQRALPHKERYFFDCGRRVPIEPHRLAAVVQINRSALPPAALARLRGFEAASALYNCVHSPRPAEALGRTKRIFTAFTQMVSAGVSFWRLMVPKDLASLREAAAIVAAALEG